jgi:chromosome segregation ATPase
MAASWTEVISSVQTDHAKIEAQRRAVEGEGTAVRADLVEADRALEQLTQEASSISSAVACSLAGQSCESSMHVVQQRQHKGVRRAAVLAEEVQGARNRIQALSQRVASTAHTAGEAIPRLWGKASGAIAAQSKTLAATEQRHAELKLSSDRLLQASRSLHDRARLLQNEIRTAAACTADKQSMLMQLRTSLSRAQSTSAALVEQLAALDPMESLAREQERHTSTIRKLQDRIASVRSETSDLEAKILAIDIS